VQAALERLANRGGPPEGQHPGVFAGALVVMLARQPGSRESRYAHLLGGPVAGPVAGLSSTMAAGKPASGLSETDRLAEMEAAMVALQIQVAKLTLRIAKLESTE